MCLEMYGVDSDIAYYYQLTGMSYIHNCVFSFLFYLLIFKTTYDKNLTQFMEIVNLKNKTQISQQEMDNIDCYTNGNNIPHGALYNKNSE